MCVVVLEVNWEQNPIRLLFSHVEAHNCVRIYALFLLILPIIYSARFWRQNKFLKGNSGEMYYVIT